MNETVYTNGLNTEKKANFMWVIYRTYFTRTKTRAAVATAIFSINWAQKRLIEHTTKHFKKPIIDQ